MTGSEAPVSVVIVVISVVISGVSFTVLEAKPMTDWQYLARVWEQYLENLIL